MYAYYQSSGFLLLTEILICILILRNVNKIKYRLELNFRIANFWLIHFCTEQMSTHCISIVNLLCFILKRPISGFLSSKLAAEIWSQQTILFILLARKFQKGRA